MLSLIVVAATPIAPGQPAGVEIADVLLFPEAATTTTPALTACETALQSVVEVPDTPRLRLRTDAPWFFAHRIPLAIS